MFDLEELEKLKTLGARRVRYADGAEVEFETYGDVRAVNAIARQLQGVEEDQPAPAQMPSRQELRDQAAKLVPDTDGAPVVTP